MVAHDDGLALLQTIIETAPAYLKKDSVLDASIARLTVEIGYTQGPIVKEIFMKNGFKNVDIVQDIAGKDRIVQGY